MENVPAITPNPNPQKGKGCGHSIRNCHVTWQSSKKLHFNHINAGILHRLLSVDRQNTSERTGVCHLKFQTGQVIRPATHQHKNKSAGTSGKTRDLFHKNLPPKTQKKIIPDPPKNSAAHHGQGWFFRGPPNHFPYEGMYITL